MNIFGNYRFRPGLWSSLVTLLLLPCLMALGFWQLDRADQKREMHQVFLDRQTDDPLVLNRASEWRKDPEDLYWRQAIVSGEFIPGPLVYLDNQVVNRKAGYFVYSLFRPDNSNRYLLINYGWIAAGMDRNVLPDVNLPDRHVVIRGRIRDVPATGILLDKESTETMQGNYRVQVMDIGRLSSLLDKELLPFVVRIGPDSEYGLTREWSPPGSDEAMHQGYAFQWFALAATLIIIYLVVNLRKEKNR